VIFQSTVEDNEPLHYRLVTATLRTCLGGMFYFYVENVLGPRVEIRVKTPNISCPYSRAYNIYTNSIHLKKLDTVK
jgi:hypothetical protein